MRYLAAILALLAVCLLLIDRLSESAPPVQAEISLQEALSDKSGRFAEVKPGRAFQFPADHGPHPEFKTEWWYFTGNLADNQGREFGYQLTLFRVGNLLPEERENASQWASPSLYMGHLGLSDISREKFYTQERLGREGVGLAGALENGERIWLEDWEIQRRESGWHLSAKVEQLSLELELSDQKPPTLQGRGGYSQKGPLPRHASYYVSQTRLATVGTVSLEGTEYQLAGTSWFDHEWSSEAMADGLVGWDWFSLQLDDQSELMLYLLRYKDGRLEPASSGALVSPDGAKQDLKLADFTVEVLDRYKAESGTEYPNRWRIEVPSLSLSLVVSPKMAEQEMIGRVPYWEGAVKVEGKRDDRPIQGHGFVELTGYGSTK
ncbi:MAG: carotenoid 1,2-hydratase [Candidatus Eremiobacteraeota bacterium]|nr:carotenoid 1,2-hydratase [Candidatus Eremiobacteraeota bacterium]